ncbi:MAG: DUF2007 domain-containing protein [Gelidibacter sp.]|nr:DUF2007 domain-containing protein [Gelidibacter sp.]
MKKIYSGTSQAKILGVKDLLETNGIAYQEINKLDSSYVGLFGDIEIHVDEADVERAEKLLQANTLD